MKSYMNKVSALAVHLNTPMLPVATTLLLLVGLALFVVASPALAQIGGPLSVEIVASYNLVVDSNATSPSTYAPSVATVMGRFCNTGDTPLTNVSGYIGDGTTPGTYPFRDSSTEVFIAQHPALANTGLYSLSHLGGRIGTADATRFMGTIPVGECRVQYWHFTYPQCSELDRTPPCSGVPTWGDSVKPYDDLWLKFNIWGTSEQGTSSATWTMTMRNEISAMANKIEPNPDGVWFNTKGNVIAPGETITSNGILYELGVINQGFDNDNDSTPDYNAWMQPIGDASYDPSCFRLIKTSSLVTVTLSGGSPDLIIETDDLNPDPIYGGPLYYTNLPVDNTGTRGKVFYTFLALDGPCSTSLSPYQEVASGFDNEKFNGDYGTGIPPLGSYEPKVTIDKSASPNVIPLGSTTTYVIPFANSGTADAGMGLSSGGSTPVVISDTVPNGMEYVGLSADYTLDYSPNNDATIRWSTDSGLSWSTTDPGNQLSTWPNNKVIIQWWLNDALPAGSTGSYAEFQATVPLGYSGSPFIDNCADARFGVSAPFDQACAPIMVPGNNTLGDFVWRDEDLDGIQDAGEAGINAIAVTLYWDRNSDGQLDSNDLLLATIDTYNNGADGYYDFTQLPDGNYLAVVDNSDPNLPEGYRLTTSKVQAVALDPGGTNPSGVTYLDADFGFGPALRVQKTLTSENPSYEGDQVIYRIALANRLPGDGSGQPASCQYKVWAQTGTTGTAPKNFTNYANAFGANGPDSLYASADFATGANKWIDGRTYSTGTRLGTITKVEVIFQIYVDYTLVDDYATLLLYEGTNQLNPTAIIISAAELNNHIGAAKVGLLAKDVTAFAPGGTWDWSDFGLNLGIQLDEQKNQGSDIAILFLDAIGFRITTNQTCGDPSDTIDPLPLTDTFDATKLQFLSATPPESSIAGGTITWNNLGPLYPGQTKFVTLIFKALQPPSNQPTTHTNCANVTDARFLDGLPTNDVSSCTTHDINPTARIGDTVWADQNSNGTIDAGEQGIPNVRVFLCAGNANPCNASNAVQTTYTNANGLYYFDGVRNGQWTVGIDTTTLPPGSTQTYDFDGIGGNSANRSVTTIANAVDDLQQDFGYRFPAAIYGNVWEDADGDSNKETGDTGISGVTVYLCQSTPCTSGNSIAQTTTDGNGNYLFGNLGNGTYYVGIANTAAPLGTDWTNTSDPEGAFPTAPGNFPHQSAAIVVNTPRLYGSYDFGYYRTGSFQLGDTVYVDWNGNGTQDSGEEGIGNITIYLYEDDDNNGVIDPGDGLVATTETGADGKYLFTDRGAGSYIVIVDRNDPDFPGNHVQTQDPDEDGVLCTTCDSRGRATLGPDDLTVDFGYKPTGAGSIGDFVWRDLDHDGIQDGGSETGIADITVNLYEDVNGNGVIDAGDALVKTTSTGADGKYLFSGLYVGTALNPARYLVDVDTTDPQLPTDGSGQPYILSTNNDPHLVTLSPTDPTYLAADFGFTPGGVIGDYVWQDTDGDGLQEEGEPPIAGVVVNLYVDVNGDGHWDAGDTLYATDTTDANGLYEFTSLPAGNYVVQVQTGGPLANFKLTYDPDASYPPCSESSIDCDSQSGASLSPGQVDRTHDYGYQPLGVIGDYVWMDLNGDGVQDGDESGISGVTVRLYDSSNNLVGTTQTNTYGYYSFVNLGAGDYTVRVDASTLPSGLSQTFDPDGTVNNETTVTLPGGGSILTADFGYRGVNSVSGIAYRDPNDNAIKDSNETETYPGVTIYLWYCGADDICGNGDDRLYDSMLTDANGNYAFTHLPDGRYRVSVNAYSPPVALYPPTITTTPTVFHDVDLDQAMTNPNPVNVPDQNFGFYKPIPTAVVLVSLTAVGQDNAILVSWETASEINLVGFNLYRADSPEGPWTQLNDQPIYSEAFGSPMGASYSHLDSTVESGKTYYYRLDALDSSGESESFGPVAAQAPIAQTEIPMHRIYLPVVSK